jgi:hypothetical protein
MASSRRLTISENFVRIDALVRGYRPPNHVETSSYYVPVSQRDWSWKPEKQALFIDSIMLNYPIPSIICNCDEHGRYAIYDGRHRIETLWRFYNNEVQWKDSQQNRRHFKDMTEVERERFLERKLCVMVVDRATITELGDIFERLNSGVGLKAYDLFWNRRDTPLVALTISKFIRSNELSAVWGDINLANRKKLANYVGIVAGLATADSNNFTASYTRISETCLQLNSVDHDEAERRVAEGIQALISLYTRANTEYPLTNKKKLSPYTNLGLVNAFFLADWMAAASNIDKDACITKWVRFVGALRNPETEGAAKSARATEGAQNLTTAKISRVLQQINNYIDGGLVGGRVPEWGGEAFDEEEDDSVESE